MKYNNRKFRKENIKSRLLLYALIITFLINVIFYVIMRQYAVEEFQQVGSALTNEVSQSLKMWMNEHRKMASMVGLATPIAEWGEEPSNKAFEKSVSRYLRILTGRYNQFENISISRFKNPEQPWLSPETGRYELDCYRVGSDPKAIINFEETGTIQAILDGKDYYVSSIVKSKETGKPIFYYSIPLTQQNKVIGMITFSLKMSYFTEALVQNVSYSNTGYLFFIDDRGETIAHINSSYILSDATYLEDTVNELLGPLKIGETDFRGQFQGVWKYYYGLPCGLDSEYVRNQWYIVFTQNESEMYGQANRYLLVMGITSFVLIAIFMMTVYRADRHRSRFFIESHEKMEKELLEEKLKQKNNEMVRQINLDQLTGISHFQSIQRYLEYQISEIDKATVGNMSNNALSFVLFNVDQLGAFNEKEGYSLGDVVLNYIGKLLKDSYALPIVTGRLYGDVFAIVFKGKTLIESVVLVEQFRNEYEKPSLSLIPRKPTLSFSIVQWQGESAGEIILKAEALLKKSKEEGTRQIKY